jgi:hypothetical protein
MPFAATSTPAYGVAVPGSRVQEFEPTDSVPFGRGTGACLTSGGSSTVNRTLPSLSVELHPILDFACLAG